MIRNPNSLRTKGQAVRVRWGKAHSGVVEGADPFSLVPCSLPPSKQVILPLGTTEELSEKKEAAISRGSGYAGRAGMGKC